MRTFIKSQLIPTAVAALALIFGSTAMLPCSAAEVNSHEVHSGDIVDYELHAIACPTKIRALDLSVFYDDTALEYVEGSLETPTLQNPVYNTDIPGEIKLNAVTLDGWDYNEDGVIVSAKFRVISEDVGDISLYSSVKNFLDESKTELKDSYVYDVTRTGEDNTPIQAESSPEASAASSKSSTAASQNESSVEAKSAPAQNSAVSPAGSGEAENNSQNVSSAVSLPSDIPEDKAIIFDTLDTARDNSGSNNNTLIMIICAAIIVLIAVVFVIIFKDSDGKGKGNHSSE